MYRIISRHTNNSSHQEPNCLHYYHIVTYQYSSVIYPIFSSPYSNTTPIRQIVEHPVKQTDMSASYREPAVGFCVGSRDGRVEGAVDGNAVGVFVGATGAEVGVVEGTGVGLSRVYEGIEDGLEVGLAVGAVVGTADKSEAPKFNT